MKERGFYFARGMIDVDAAKYPSDFPKFIRSCAYKK